MTEAILNRLGKGKFVAFSAGSHPAGHVHPYTVDLLTKLSYETLSLRSRAGTSLPTQARLSSILCLRFVMTRRESPALSGRAIL